MIRENTEGLYVGVEAFIAIDGDPKAVAQSMAIVTRKGCERIIRYAFDYAVKQGRKKVTICHKANILKAVSGLFSKWGKASRRSTPRTFRPTISLSTPAP